MNEALCWSAWQRFPKVIPFPSGSSNYWWMRVLDAVQSEGSEIRLGFHHCLSHTEIPSNYLNPSMVLCTSEEEMYIITFKCVFEKQSLQTFNLFSHFPMHFLTLMLKDWAFHGYCFCAKPVLKSAADINCYFLFTYLLTLNWPSTSFFACNER